MDKKDLSYKLGQIIDTKIESIREETQNITEALIHIRASISEINFLNILKDDIKNL